MRTISIKISDLEYQKFGITIDRLSFSGFVDIISRKLSRQNLANAVDFAERYKLYDMTMGEIFEEVRVVRNGNMAHS